MSDSEAVSSSSADDDPSSVRKARKKEKKQKREKKEKKEKRSSVSKASEWVKHQVIDAKDAVRDALGPKPVPTPLQRTTSDPPSPGRTPPSPALALTPRTPSFSLSLPSVATAAPQPPVVSPGRPTALDSPGRRAALGLGGTKPPLPLEIVVASAREELAAAAASVTPSDDEEDASGGCEGDRFSKRSVGVSLPIAIDQNDVLVKIALVGSAGVGKTSYRERLCHGNFNENYKGTIGVELSTYRYRIFGLECVVKASLWDTSGAEKFRAVAPVYYRGSHALIGMFDVTNRKSYEQLVDEHWGILREAQEACARYAAEQHCEPVVMIVGNKIDRRKRERTVRSDEAAEFCKQHNFAYYECSAKTSQNVERAFQELIELVYYHRIRTGTSPALPQTFGKQPLVRTDSKRPIALGISHPVEPAAPPPPTAEPSGSKCKCSIQ